MRQLLFLLALMGTLGFARAAETPAVKTNNVTIGMPGTLEIVTPPDWTLSYTNLNLADRPVTFELHSASNTVVIRFYVRWDGFTGVARNPTEADMGKIVSNNIVTQYLPVAVEKHFALEKFHGPTAAGIFGRITDSTWSPVVKDTYPNLVEGMFRCGNLWGNFNILTFGKNGASFKEALKVLESMRRKP